MSQANPAFETEARPATLGSHLNNAFNQWKSPSPIAQAGQPAPDWALRDAIYNRAQSKSILLGNVVAMVFCGTWCVPCQWEIQIWKELHKSYFKSDFKIVGMFLDYKESISPFAHAFSISSLYYCCPVTEKIKWDFGVNPTGRIPFLALIDRQGYLRSTLIGYHAKDAYESAIKAIL